MQHCITAFNRLERSYPPIGRYDTIRSDKNGNIVSAHGKPNCFADHEIVEIHPIVRETTCDGIPVKFSERNKAIIQQQATRGCTTAATAMLIHDAGKSFNGQLLSRTNLGNDTSMCREITSAGLQPRVHKNIELENLDQLLQEHGSAIVSIFDQMGVAGHVVVVDEITESGIRLRDPYHGWEITVSHDAFKRCYQKCDSIITVSHSPE